MPDFTHFFLMTPADVKRYAVEVLHFFHTEDGIQCAEIGDGNINYVTRVWSEATGRSVIVKQADKLLRSSGRPLDINRNRLEARMLQLERELVPELVPEVYRWDETMAAISMEDVSTYGNLRKELAVGRVYAHLAENLSDFLASSLLPTTDLILDRREKKRRAQFFTNPDLCDITEDLVLTEPYFNYKNRNLITPGNEAFVEEFLYRDRALHKEVASLRNGFMNNAQALLHGDLHSGSIFANARGVKIIDPEFAFYGPMGYDIGNVIANLFFPWANKAFAAPEETETAAALETLICRLYDETRARLETLYDARVTFLLYRVPAFRAAYLDGVMADSLGYAGTEIIRRTVGDSKVPELTSVTEPILRVPMERALVKLGIALIKNRGELHTGAALTEIFRLILA
ncbi:methylthioribose kinase [Oscillibacter valericigenes Sjm18-20]|nr:methylthioribose kinase [Oscillibacter valericigenes Sjm18-20]